MPGAGAQGHPECGAGEVSGQPITALRHQHGRRAGESDRTGSGGGPRNCAGDDSRELRKAQAVVFVGYRFPPSDSLARRFLIESLVGNESTYLGLHTVLGDDINHPHSRRLHGLLSYAMKRASRTLADGPTYRSNELKIYNLTQHPLWAQDFLDVFEAPHLTSPYPQE